MLNPPSSWRGNFALPFPPSSFVEDRFLFASPCEGQHQWSPWCMSSGPIRHSLFDFSRLWSFGSKFHFKCPPVHCGNNSSSSSFFAFNGAIKFHNERPPQFRELGESKLCFPCFLPHLMIFLLHRGLGFRCDPSSFLLRHCRCSPLLFLPLYELPRVCHSPGRATFSHPDGEVFFIISLWPCGIKCSPNSFSYAPASVTFVTFSTTLPDWSRQRFSLRSATAID